MRSSKAQILVMAFLLLLVFAAFVGSHCQIPCGIYNDKARLELLHEHVTTIQKSVEMINDLSRQPKPDYNQIVRWVNNKDSHADQLSEIATYYFLAQRIKPVEKSPGKEYSKYLEMLEKVHKIVFYAMKSKQSSDSAVVANLHDAVEAFEDAYSKENIEQMTRASHDNHSNK